MTVNEIYSVIDKKFPFKNQMDFDNAGFLIGDEKLTVTGIVVALDCTKEVFDFALENGCNLIVSHHPVIFSALKSVRADDLPYLCIKNGISVISAHTNLDFSFGGINDILCEKLGLENVERFLPYGDGVFEMRIGEIKPTAPHDFAKTLKKVFGIPIKFTAGSDKIKKVAVGGGACGHLVNDAKQNGADALVTSDIKHHLFLEAKHIDLSLYECGHFNTEDIVTEPLAEFLKQKADCKVLSFHKTDIEYI